MSREPVKIYPQRISGTGHEFGPTSLNIGPLTAVLIGLSVAVALFSKLGADMDVLNKLFISTGDFDPKSLQEILQGQVWRLISPIFIHFDAMHIFFNMLWLKDLGTMIEKRIGSATLLGLVLVVGVASNLGQFYASGPYFGGMSGVVYGLLGYVWMKSKFDPGSGLFMEKQTVIMMIGWFFLCLAGVLGHVANTAHGVGLVIGIMWGFASAKIRSRRF